MNEMETALIPRVGVNAKEISVKGHPINHQPPLHAITQLPSFSDIISNQLKTRPAIEAIGKTEPNRKSERRG